MEMATKKALPHIHILCTLEDCGNKRRACPEHLKVVTGICGRMQFFRYPRSKLYGPEAYLVQHPAPRSGQPDLFRKTTSKIQGQVLLHTIVPQQLIVQRHTEAY